MTFWEKLHQEVQFIDLVMFVLTVVWLILIILHILGITGDIWFLHFVFGACWLMWAGGFGTRWNDTGEELSERAWRGWWGAGFPLPRRWRR